jgi:hypothetical protein
MEYRYKEMMIDEMLLQAVAAHLHGEKVKWNMPIEQEQWEDFFRLASEHSLLPLVFETVCNCESIQSMDRDRFMQMKQISTRQVIFQIKRTEELKQVYKQLSEKEIYPVVVKGIVCRLLYPIPDDRISNDEDLWINWEEFSRTNELMAEWGMKLREPEKEIEKEFEVPYYNPKGCLVIELHKDLFAESSDAYGTFNQLFQGAKERKIPIDVDGVTIYTLEYTDHLAYLIAHAFKHFLHSGFGIRQVCDIVLFAKKYQDIVDWDKIYDICKKMRALYFTAALFEIGRKYLDYELTRPYESAKWNIEVDPEDLLADLLDSGIFGKKNLARQHSSTITLNAVASEKKGKEAKVSVRKSLFPSAKDISGRYLYLKKHPYLLPVAWTDRIWHYYKENHNHKGKNQAEKTIEIGKQRVELLKKYKVIDEK